MNSEQKRNYFKSKGLSCPFCNSKDLKAESPRLNEDGCEVDVNCEDCSKEWVELYTLTNIKSQEEC